LAHWLRSERIAISLLKRADWHLESAVDAFFSSGGAGLTAGPRVDTAKIGSLFDRYKGACPSWHQSLCAGDPRSGIVSHAACLVEDGDDTIGISGLERFCSDLGVEPTDMIMLLIAWKVD
jgi:hypothetical protein